MEITSYLLGKKSSGGGGSSELDWKALGYESVPNDIVNDYNYSKSIQDNWDPSQTDLSNKFNNDTTLKYMPLVDMKNVTTTYRMFYGCVNLYSIPVLETSSNLTSISEMFRECRSLAEIDLSRFDTTNVTSISVLFRGCSSLKKIDMRNFDFTNISIYTNAFYSVPTDCLIIVKDTTQKEWFATNYSTMTNVQTVEEYEAM